MYDLADLMKLDASFNQLEDATHIHLVSNLRILRLSHNLLIELPEAIGVLTALESLSLDDNRLESLPRTHIYIYIYIYIYDAMMTQV